MARTVGRGRPDPRRCSPGGFLGVMTNKTKGQDSRARRAGRWSKSSDTHARSRNGLSRALGTADLKGEKGPIAPRKGCGWLCVRKARVTPKEVKGKLGSGKVHACQRGDTRGRRRVMVEEHERDAERAVWGRGMLSVSARAPQSDLG